MSINITQIDIMLDPKVSERINRSLNFQEADHVPVCDFLDNKKVFHYFSPEAKTADQAKVKAYHELGIDVCWRFERRRIHRRDGFFKLLNKYTSRKHRFDVLSEDELALEFEEFKEQQKLFEPYTYLAMSVEGCLSIAYRSLGFENFCEKMYLEPIEIERLIDIFAENIYTRAREFAKQELGEMFFITDDIAYKKGLIFSPSFLQQSWLPRIKQAIVPLKEKNIKVILHSDGDISSIIDGLIDVGIDGIHPVDREAEMDIGILKKKYAKSLLLFGNIVLYAQDEKGIIEQTKRCIKNSSFGGGHFIGSSSGIDKNIDLKNVFTFYSTIKDYGRYPIKI